MIEHFIDSSDNLKCILSRPFNNFTLIALLINNTSYVILVYLEKEKFVCSLVNKLIRNYNEIVKKSFTWTSETFVPKRKLRLIWNWLSIDLQRRKFRFFTRFDRHVYSWISKTATLYAKYNEVDQYAHYYSLTAKTWKNSTLSWKVIFFSVNPWIIYGQCEFQGNDASWILFNYFLKR